MKYLYGDASESPLDINYLDLLRDTLDFGAAVMLAHGNITEHRKRAAELETDAKIEREQLEAVNDDVDRTLATCKKRVTTKDTRACVDAIRAVAAAEIKRADAAIQGHLAKELGQINDAIAREQANNVKRLESLLLKHDLPECALWVNARFHPKSNRYLAELIGKAACDVAFMIDLEIPPDHLLKEPVRIDRIAPGLTVKVPEKSGWVRKSVKMRPHKLAKEYIISVSHSTKKTTIKLRNALHEADSGYDLIFGTKNRVAVARIAKGTEAVPFEPELDDKKSLLAFYDELSRSLSLLESSRRGLRGAQLDGTPLAEHADATVLVRRLVQQMAPVVQEISNHSLSPEELVLKRVLADDRREEIFLSKADLRRKIEPLPSELREVFGPLHLEVERRDMTGPPAPVRAGKTQVMIDPEMSGARVDAGRSTADRSPEPPARAPMATMPEPATQRRAIPDAAPSEPVLIVDEEETSVHDKGDVLPRIEDVNTADEALPLPLSASAVIPEPIRHTLKPGATGSIPINYPPPLPRSTQGVAMPSPTRKARGHRSAPPAPPSNRAALPKPSAPPPRGRGGEGRPILDIHASDSIDVQLDELLKSSD